MMQFNYELLETYQELPYQYPPKNVNKYFATENHVFILFPFLFDFFRF